MTTELKTLKDLRILPYSVASLSDLRQEAINWIKDCKERQKIGLPNLTQEEFIIEFFNIIEEDLK